MLPNILKENDPMPYGKHIGVKMKDLSPNYLLWLYDNGKCNASVKKYVEDNKGFLVLMAKNKKSF